VYLGEQATAFVLNPHHSVFDLHLVPVLIKLSHADDVGGEARNVVDVVEGAVLAGLEGEEDRAIAFDVDDGAVAKADRARDARVDVDECSPGPGHMIGGPRVQNPAVGLWILFLTDSAEDFFLDEMYLLSGCPWLERGTLGFSGGRDCRSDGRSCWWAGRGHGGGVQVAGISRRSGMRNEVAGAVEVNASLDVHRRLVVILGHVVLFLPGPAATIFSPVAPSATGLANVVPGGRPAHVGPLARVRAPTAAGAGPAAAVLRLATGLALSAGGRATAGAALLAGCLVSSPPLFLGQQQLPHGLGGRLGLVAAALEDAQSTGDLLDRGGVEVEDHLAGHCSLLQVLRDHLQKLLDDLRFAYVVTERA
jgi:hypothetical protein